MDVFSREKRSEIMSRIKGRGNAATELVVRALFRANSITGWRRQFSIVGKPDFAFPSAKVAVFVDGCFWHGCPKCRRIPKSNQDYWLQKIRSNKARDRRVSAELKAKGWTVLRVWQCQLAKPARFLNRIKKLLEPGLSL